MSTCEGNKYVKCGLRGDWQRCGARWRKRASLIFEYELEATPVLAATPAAGGRPVVGPRASEKGESE